VGVVGCATVVSVVVETVVSARRRPRVYFGSPRCVVGGNSIGPVLDLHLVTHGVRWTAYLEMLMTVSIGGLTIYATAQIVWRAVRDLERPANAG